MTARPQWFDAHLDLAYLAECGRDMLAPLDPASGPHPPAAVTLPALRDGNVVACLGTIFTEPDGDDGVAYPSGDVEKAHAAGLRQLDRYHAWAAAGAITLMTGGDPRPLASRHSPPSLGILVEGADPIRSPEELPWWVSRGVVAIGLTWARSSRYSGGNSPETGLSGLTDLGRAMIRAMDECNVVHDLSHLSDRAMDELLALTDRPVIASHSNCRALLDITNQRHLRDDSIKEIARRGGVIGLNLVRNFIRTGLDRNDPNDRPSIDEALNHVEYICDLVGHRRAVGMGSDLDGGISANDLPAGINQPRDFVKFADGLRARGWSDDELWGFQRENWERFFRDSFARPVRERAAAEGSKSRGEET